MGIDRTVAHTVAKSIRFIDYKRVGKRKVTMEIMPGNNGLEFDTPMGKIAFRSDYVHSFKRWWTHLLVLTNKKVENPRLEDIAVFVPEHVVSACSLAGITDGIIRIKNTITYTGEELTWLIHKLFKGIPYDWKAIVTPVLNGNIDELYQKLKSNRVAIQGKYVPSYRVSKESYFGDISNRIKVKPADKLEITLLAMPNDKCRMHPKTMEIDDVYGSAEDHLTARALTRPPFLTYICPKSAEFFKGNLNSDILLFKKWESHSKKLERMQPPYRNGHNEQFAHAIYSDIMAELVAIWPGKFHGKFIFHNLGGGHTNRLKCLRKMESEGVVQPYNVS